MDWFSWTWDIEVKLASNIVDDFSSDDTIFELLELISSAIQISTKDNCQKKCVSKHSKPFWTPELTTLSSKLRLDLKSYLTRNTDSGLATYLSSKEQFEEARQQACQQFILSKTKDLNMSQAQKFWKEFNKIFKSSSDQSVEALQAANGTILTDNADIEEEMFKTFFRAKHLENNLAHFDEDFHQEINGLYNEIKNSDFKPYKEMLGLFPSSSALYCPVSELEVSSTFKGIKTLAASFDNHEIHQSMLKKLGPNAIYALSKLFSLCLRNGTWMWNESKIVFLKKDGKPSYSKAGAYRPISISPYVGKLFERILAQRLEQFLKNAGIVDVNQEGFSKGKNTVRYLHRLTAGIKGDISRKLTVLCLFIDFEKAFDSVWKKGLIVKLWKLGVHGCYLKTIDSFLFGRTVCLLINGYLGPKRDCLDYGLPQGSVLSPVLFKLYVLDIEEACANHESISVFKFADDGTVKVIGRNLEECLFYLQIAMDGINLWTSLWRMVINCDVNKTEIICFNTYEAAALPSSLSLGGKPIYLTNQTKVLGVTLDNKMGFQQHSKNVYNNLVYRWISMSRYANRNWGMNQAVIIRLVKTILSSTLFYGSIVWMSNSNLGDIQKLWYTVLKAAVGAVFNAHSAVLEVIVGMPPIQIMERIIAIKHYLKSFHDKEDIHFQFIRTQIMGSNPKILGHLRDVKKFLQWKTEHYPKEIQSEDIEALTDRGFEHLSLLSQKTYKYNKVMIQKFTEQMWRESLLNRLMSEGWHDVPQVSCSPLPIPFGLSRDTEVLIMSLMYKNNLLNSFLFRQNKSKWTSPLCACGAEEQSALHILTSCELVNCGLRSEAQRIMKLCNDLGSSEDPTFEENCAILNCSRDSKFICICAEIVKTEGLRLKRSINLAS
ncbi:hypothetical protein ACHWQZ_G011765 [Mnemiopsis leidyi]